APNFAYDLCLQKITLEQIKDLNLSHLRVAINGAEPVRAETLDQFVETFGTVGFSAEAFYPAYGLAESTVYVAGGLKTGPPKVLSVDSQALQHNEIVIVPENKPSAQKLVGCGQASLDQKFIIVDPETQTLTPSDRVGEIWVSGPSVAQGYWDRQEQTKETFEAYLTGEFNGDGPGPYLRTGDLGFKWNGELFVTGRLKDLIIIRGRNYYPQDIETTASQAHETLAQNSTAAFMVPIDNEDKLIICQEVQRTALRKIKKEQLVDEIVEAITQAVSEQHEIQIYDVVLLKPQTIPKTSSGKIQRKRCQAHYLSGTLSIVGSRIIHQLDADIQDQHDLDLATWQSFTSPINILEHLDQIDSQEHPEIIQGYLKEHLATALRIQPSQLDADKPLTTLGIDSLVAVELRNQVTVDLGVDLPLEKVIEGPSINELTEFLVGQLALNRLASTPPSEEQDDDIEEITL
ncbi:MAG: AMP-binding protein, partial [Chloroflexota bacterium]